MLADVRADLRAASPLAITATLSRARSLNWAGYLAEGSVVLDLDSGAFRVDASVREVRAEAERDVTLFFDGDAYTYLDHTDRAVTTGDSPLLGGVASRMAWDLARVLPAEPERLIDAGAKLGDPLSLAGERCRTILAKTPDGPTAHVWYLAERDGLPRVWETSRELGAGDSLRKRMTVRTIETGAEPTLAPAELEGYERRAAPEWDDPEAHERSADAGAFTTLDEGAPTLRAAFNAAKDRPRAIGLFAPS